MSVRNRQKKKIPSKDRYIVRRIRDKDGNIQVKRYKRRQSSGISIPYRRVPSFTIGSIYLLYAYMAYQFSKGKLSDNVFGSTPITTAFETYFNSFTGVNRILNTGMLAAVVGVFIGWGLVSKGFRINRWGAAARELFAIFAIVILFTSVFSAFINEQGIVRQQDHQTNAEDDFDISGLTAPFYSDLLDGLLNLIGNIPNPQELVATITGPDINASSEYLWRWLVAESYQLDAGAKDQYDYYKKYESILKNIPNMNESSIYDLLPPTLAQNDVSLDQSSNFPKMDVSMQYLSLSNGYTGELLSPWNSIVGGAVNIENMGVDSLGNDTVQLTNANLKQNINQQPVVEATFDKSKTSGYINYDAYFVPEDQKTVTSNAVKYTDLVKWMKDGTIDALSSLDRFSGVSQAGTFSYLWGNQSLGGTTSYLNAATGGGIDGSDMQAVFDNIESKIQNQFNTSVYQVALLISNRIQNAIINLFQNGGFSLADPQANLDEAATGVDKAKYFWNKVANSESFGIKDALAGFTNMLRLFNIPARPVVGFAVGDVTPGKIEIRMEHVHVWVEALIPWTDGNGNTRYSWAAFNPIPAYSGLAESTPRLIYGKNSYGSQSDVDMSIFNGKDQTFSGADIGGVSSFKLASPNENLNVSSQVKFDNVPYAGQEVTYHFLNETDMNAIVDGTGFDIQSGGLTVGEEIGTVLTDETTLYANLTIYANAKGDVSVLYTNSSTNQPINRTLEGYTVKSINLAGTSGQRNIYGIVATNGFSYNFTLLGWTLKANLSVSITNLPSYQIVDPGLFGGDSTEAIFSMPGETLVVNASLTVGADKDPIDGTPLELMWMALSDFNNINSDINGGTLSPDNYQMKDANGVPIDFPATNSSGNTMVVVPVPSGVTINQYYAVVAYDGSLTYGFAIVHIAENLTISSVLSNSTLSERVIYSNENDTDFYINVTLSLSDSTLALFGGATPRVVQTLNLDYFLVERYTFEAIDLNSATQMPNFLSTCDNSVTCFNITSTGDPTFTFSGYNSTIYGIRALFNLTYGYVPDASYYFVIFSPEYNKFGTTDRIGFSSQLNPYSLGYEPQVQLIVPPDKSSNSNFIDFIPILQNLVSRVIEVEKSPYHSTSTNFVCSLIAVLLLSVLMVDIRTMMYRRDHN